MDELRALLLRHTEYLHYRNLRPGTIYQRRRVLIRTAQAVDPKKLLELTGEDIKDALTARGVQPESIATDLSHLRGFYKWAVMDGLLDIDPTARLLRPRLPKRLPRPIADDDLWLALDQADPQMRMLLLFAAYAGLRACEIAQVRGEHLMLKADPPIVVVMESKGGGMSSAPLAPILLDALRFAPRTGFLFSRADDTGPLKPHSISQRANNYLHSLGIAATLHQLRHWYGTQLYMASDCDLRTTQEGMRHDSIASTVLYTFIAPARVTKAVRAIPHLEPPEPPALPEAV